MFAVPERLRHNGDVVTELDGAAVDEIVGKLEALGVESVAVALLHSYADPGHERRVGEAVAEALPEASISLSHDVAPIIGEYERTSTAVVNAYIQPRFRHYLEALDGALRGRGFTGELFINQGNGGLTTPEKVARFPIRALESGPAAGVSLAAWVGGTIGRTELVAFDMGGTTAKACLIEHGSPRMERHFDVDQTLMRKGTGLPVVAPTVDLIEIGAGGGSIARVGLGIIEVGPQSAGADPGPVCYGAGGEVRDGHGRERRARVPEPRLLPGGQDGARRRVGSPRDRGSGRRTARARPGRRRVGHSRGGDEQHGACDSLSDDRARLGSA